MHAAIRVRKCTTCLKEGPSSCTRCGRIHLTWKTSALSSLASSAHYIHETCYKVQTSSSLHLVSEHCADLEGLDKRCNWTQKSAGALYSNAMYALHPATGTGVPPRQLWAGALLIVRWGAPVVCCSCFVMDGTRRQATQWCLGVAFRGGIYIRLHIQALNIRTYVWIN
jgi:hypothetical protein